MPKSEVETLISAINRYWPNRPSDKAKRYIGQFYNHSRRGTKISAQVEGNYGTYTVSIQVEGESVVSACSCYIGKGGFCHHCSALAATFLNDPSVFSEVETKQLEDIQDVDDIQEYLKGITLEALLKALREKGITQKAFAESIGMNPRHLSSIKASELRNRYYNELGATKLACLWVLEHPTKTQE